MSFYKQHLFLKGRRLVYWRSYSAAQISSRYIHDTLSFHNCNRCLSGQQLQCYQGQTHVALARRLNWKRTKGRWSLGILTDTVIFLSLTRRSAERWQAISPVHLSRGVTQHWSRGEDGEYESRRENESILDFIWSVGSWNEPLVWRGVMMISLYAQRL